MGANRLGFLVSIVYVALLARAALATAEDAAVALNLPRVLAGATLLAIGAQIPDVMGSMGLAKGGLTDGALANAVGSQVANIGLGVGLPFLCQSAANGGAPVVFARPAVHRRTPSMQISTSFWQVSIYAEHVSLQKIEQCVAKFGPKINRPESGIHGRAGSAPPTWCSW